jgi:Arc/MetJ family transcription regulator
VGIESYTIRISNLGVVRYTRGVHKTTLEVDEELLARAGAILGTRGLKATVQRALEEIVAREARRRFGQRLQKMDGLELDNRDLMSEAWR